MKLSFFCFSSFLKIHVRVCCTVVGRYGFSRAGSVALAFVLAENASMTYEEAVHHVTARRPVLPHVDLKETIYQIFPRTGPLPVCPNVS